MKTTLLSILLFLIAGAVPCAASQAPEIDAALKSVESTLHSAYQQYPHGHHASPQVLEAAQEIYLALQIAQGKAVTAAPRGWETTMSRDVSEIHATLRIPSQHPASIDAHGLRATVNFIVHALDMTDTELKAALQSPHGR